ncbi:KGK domain-containing protein [Geminocystis herdmanii]|uniref:KGK domain-containing protein n=1 Tax=Geminocystis herdmanii TaxID=669359 RepID=UPI000345F709|nr:KGK domain-containing protein [Geminocystis herdmanii]
MTNKKIESLQQTDVIKLSDQKTKWVMSHRTFTVNDFTSALVKKYTSNEEILKYSEEGIEAEVLLSGKGWQKGKVRLSIEFIPDKVDNIDSNLDDLMKKCFTNK